MHIHPFSLEDTEAEQAWETLLRVSPQRNPYSLPAYARAFADAFGYELSGIGLWDARERLTGGILLFVERKGPYRRVVVPPFTQYATVIFEEPLSTAAIHARQSPLDHLLQHIQEAYATLHLSLHPSLFDIRPFRWHGWEVSPYYTYRMPLKDRDRMLRDWSAGTRRLFLKHEGQFEIREAPWAGRTIIDLARRSYERHNCAFPADPERLAHAAQTLLDADLARAFIAFREDPTQPEAGVILLHDRKTAYYWIAGSLPGASMTVLLGNVWPRLYAETLDRFDFVGANTPSIAEFKRRFGAQLTLYFMAMRTNRPELKVLQSLR